MQPKYATKENAAKIMQILTREYKVPRSALRFSNPLQVLVATMLSAQCTDIRVNMVTPALFRKYRTAEDFANADLKELEQIIRSTGFYHMKARHIIDSAKMIVNEFNSKVPDSMENLLKLPGVGRKTANCVLVYGFNIPAIPADTHVHRISNRLGIVKTKTPEQTEHELMRKISKKYWIKINELFVKHGQTICNPIRPKCDKCIINKLCDFKKYQKIFKR